MSNAVKKKLCWNCEGSVTMAEETCPYCGVSVIPAALDDGSHSYLPPYSPQAIHEDTIPQAPYEEEQQKENCNKSSTLPVEEPEPSLLEFKRTVLSIVLLCGGSVFFFFGLALALFSDKGVLTLQWDGTLWFIYAILAIPLLFFGWRTLMKLD